VDPSIGYERFLQVVSAFMEHCGPVGGGLEFGLTAPFGDQVDHLIGHASRFSRGQAGLPRCPGW
jgi:hypothetical protein